MAMGTPKKPVNKKVDSKNTGEDEDDDDSMLDQPAKKKVVDDDDDFDGPLLEKVLHRHVRAGGVRGGGSCDAGRHAYRPVISMNCRAAQTRHPAWRLRRSPRP